MNTSTQLMDIATRIRGMQEILGYSTHKMAEQTEVTEEIYLQYETSTVDLPGAMSKPIPGYGIDIVDTDPKLCSEERRAILGRLGVGNWKIFGGHGSVKDYCVK